MNKHRREQLGEVSDILNSLKDKFERAKEILEQVASDEQEAFDNLTDGLQAADRGQRMEEVAQNLQSIVDEMNNCEFDSWASACEEACE
jgi:AmiR/NasT family two-component response regulator